MLLVFMCSILRAENFTAPIGFAYWDVGRFYDTIPSLFYDDRDYTPEGKNSWGALRYGRKVERVAAVLDSMHFPIVALCGVESESVVRDIVKATMCDYSYLHRTIDGRDGLDFALLYYGDVLFIDYVQTFYGRIYIEGEIAQSRVGIWLTWSGYYMKSASPPHRNGEVEATIVAGRMYRKDVVDMRLEDIMRPHERAARGNAHSSSGWYMRDRIGIGGSIELSQCGVYITPWLLDDNRVPKPTFSKRGYVGGCSSYLPICIYFRMPQQTPQ
ncbi:MAG: hypothetical protein SNI18_01385 [Rikenellaceae bacterium]